MYSQYVVDPKGMMSFSLCIAFVSNWFIKVACKSAAPFEVKPLAVLQVVHANLASFLGVITLSDTYNEFG